MSNGTSCWWYGSTWTLTFVVLNVCQGLFIMKIYSLKTFYYYYKYSHIAIHGKYLYVAIATHSGHCTILSWISLKICQWTWYSLYWLIWSVYTQPYKESIFHSFITDIQVTSKSLILKLLFNQWCWSHCLVTDTQATSAQSVLLTMTTVVV